MRENEFRPSNCCVKCPHFDEFSQTCTHDSRQAIIQELAAGGESSCPVFPHVRAQSMQELERRLPP